MGVNTDIIGHLTVTPALNEAEILYLSAFGESRRYDRAGGPYEVPGNPAAERVHGSTDVDFSNRIAAGQPSFWCDWRPTLDGGALVFNGNEKFYGASRWLAYLIQHFLAPDAHAAADAHPAFAAFTFDHVVDGTVAAYQDDPGSLYLIHAVANEVYEEPLDARSRAAVPARRGVQRLLRPV